MPSCVQLGATDFGSTSDLVDPEGMPKLGYRVYLLKLTTGVRGGSYASSKLRTRWVRPVPRTVHDVAANTVDRKGQNNISSSIDYPIHKKLDFYER